MNVDKPDFQPKATEYVDSMISKIKSLEDQGNAYLSQKYLLFSVKDFPKYGILLKEIRSNRLQAVELK